MRIETFFEKFELLADTPNAVAKMRELVMWSAFSGAFSSEERNQLMPENWAVDGAPTLPAIPSSWRWQRGREVFQVIRGVSYKKSDASDTPIAGSFPLLRANNIGNGINFDGLVYVPRENIRDEQFIRSGDILIAMSSGSKKLVGKAAPIVTEFNGAFGAFCGVIRNKSEMPNDVLARYFQTPQYTSWVTAAGRGIGINNLGRGDLDLLPVPTPPLAEQKRIVAKVDELMALCDRLEAQQAERETRHGHLARASLARFADAPTPANLDYLFHKSYDITPADLRKTILTLAVQGKLVPLEVQPHVGSLDSILAEASVNGVSRGPTNDKSATEILRISAGTSRGDFYVNEDDFKHVDLPQDEIQKYQLAPGDLLACRFNGNLHYVGRFSYYRGDSGRVQVNPDKLIRFRINSETHCPRYVCLAMNAAPTREAIEAMCATTAGNIGLSAGRLKTIEIPLPPLAEQRRIVAKVDQLMALVDQLETQLDASRSAAEKLMEALVAELTAQ